MESTCNKKNGRVQSFYGLRTPLCNRLTNRTWEKQVKISDLSFNDILGKTSLRLKQWKIQTTYYFKLYFKECSMMQTSKKKTIKDFGGIEYGASSGKYQRAEFFKKQAKSKLSKQLLGSTVYIDLSYYWNQFSLPL